MVSNPRRSGLENGVMRVMIVSSESDIGGKNPNGILPVAPDMVRAAVQFKRCARRVTKEERCLKSRR
jgi:hypothetical protein